MDAGVAGLPILQCACGDIAALYSNSGSTDSWTGTSLTGSAREFHRVLHKVFSSRAIVPFRFPTVVQSVEELAKHLRDNSSQYAEQLQKFQRCVQMDISITRPGTANGNNSPRSGGEYLRARRQQFDEVASVSNQLEQSAGSVALAWHRSATQTGLRLFALIDRDSVGRFNETLNSSTVPPHFEVRVSGPWPVTQFQDLKQG